MSAILADPVLDASRRPALPRRLLGRALHALRPRGPARRWLRYGALALGLLAAVWGPCAAYLWLAAPGYVSRWALVLPGAGAGAQVNLEAIGQASTLSSSPYGNHSVDPKANYRAIATSAPVLGEAARRLELTAGEFGRPRIKLVDQTAVMDFAVTGATPEQAQRRSWALFEAFSAELERLRLDEAARREEGTRRSLGLFEEKLHGAESALLAFQSNGGLVSLEQFEELARNVENLRRQHAEVVAEKDRARGEVARVATLLGVSPERAADVFALQADEVFTRHLEEYASAESTLNVFLSKWGQNHPQVVRERARRRDARRAALERARALTGAADPALLALGSASATSGEGQLLRDMVTAQAHAEGLAAKAVALARSVREFESRTHALTERTAALESLERRHQVATAVLTSALARLDLGSSDLFVSYPLVQMLAQPTLPEDGLPPNKLYALLGAGTGTVFVLTGLVLLWIRTPFVRAISTSA